VLGRSASRYRALGESRSADERELILCNLAVRRQAFLEAGGFNERLYPNEENELLERFRLKGAGCLYLRDARVERLDRDGFVAYLRSIARYGRGRAEQLRVLPSRSSLLRLAAASLYFLALFGGALAALLGAPVLGLPAALYVSYLLVVLFRLSRRLGALEGALSAALAALTHGAYALGVFSGTVSKKPPARAEIGLERRQLRSSSLGPAKGVLP
jgi:hypothetical protein